MGIVKRISERFSHPKHIPFPLEHPTVQEFLQQSPTLVRASMVETYSREVRCEVEDAEGKVTHLGSGVKAISIWFWVISGRDGVDIPEGLKNNE